MPRRSRRSSWITIAAVVALSALAVAACGSSGDASTSRSNQAARNSLFKGYGLQILPTPTGDPHDPDADAGTPERGGTVTFALQAEDSNGYCLPEAQLDTSGQQVAAAVYDTLTRPDADGNFVPYLAKSVTHSTDYRTWTITLRKDISFSDGSPLTAEVVKNNLDAYRGTYPGRSALLFQFVFDDVATVKVTGPLTVVVNMKLPWKDFDAFLYSGRSLGIMGQSQLDDKDNCAKDLVGTGPFTLVSWKVGERYVLKPNPHYWRTGPKGQKLPYLSELDFVPISNSQTRLNAFVAGRVDATLTERADSIVKLRELAKAHKAQLVSSVRFTAQQYLMFNAGKAPFNDYDLRLAAAKAIDYATINSQIRHKIAPMANQIFPPGSPGYSPELKRTPYDPAGAKKLVAAYTKAHGTPKVVVSATPDPAIRNTAEVVAGYLDDVGFDASVAAVDQAQLISNAIAGKFQFQTFRGGGGISPGEQYVWLHSGYPTNFGHVEDPILDCLLNVGRSGAVKAACLKNPTYNASYDHDLPPGFKPLDQLDPTSATDIFRAVSLELNKKLWNIWGSYSPWTVAVKPDVHGIFGAKNPDGSAPFNGLANGTPVETLWVG